MKTLLIKNGGCSVVKPSGLNKVFAESQRNYALLKEKDAEIERLQSELRMTAENTAFAFMKRDAKLADEIEIAIDNLSISEKRSETLDKVVGLLRGEKK